MSNPALFLALLAFLTAPLVAQRDKPPAGWVGFTKRVAAYVDTNRIVGASAMLVRDGKIVARYNVGFADQRAGRRVDDRTLFHYGSITKTLASITVMQLRDRGKLSLEDPITKWIPELRLMHDPYGSIDSVTLRMLLSHTAGFQNPTWPYSRGPTVGAIRTDDLGAAGRDDAVPGGALQTGFPLQLFQPRVHLPGPCRGDHHRRTLGQLCAEESLRTARHDPELFQYNAVPSDRGPLAWLRRQRRLGDSAGRRGGPWGRLRPRDHDSERRMECPARRPRRLPGVPHRRCGRHGDAAPLDEVLSRASLEEMWRPERNAAVFSDSTGHRRDMGLGFMVDQDAMHYDAGHTGTQGGYEAFLHFNPRNRTGFVLVFNTTYHDSVVGRAPSFYNEMMTAAWALIH